MFGASSVLPGSQEWNNGVRCGKRLVKQGFAVATGGYGGAMAAVSEGAATAGGKVIGVTAPQVFPGRAGANEHVKEERPAPSLTERIHDIITLSDGAITLPGSLGTLTELVVAWNVAFVARFHGGRPMPIVTVGPVWRDFADIITTRLDTDSSLVVNVDTVDEAVDEITSALGV